MTDTLIERLDGYVRGMLDAAEGRCDNRGEGDTSKTEDAPVQQAPTLAERIATLKAVTTWIELRNKLRPDGPAGSPKDEGETSEIVRFQQQLRKRERR